MNRKLLSYLPLVTFPAAYIVLHIENPTATLVGFMLVVGGLMLSLLFFLVGLKEGDRQLRNRSIGGVIINGGYLAMLLYLVFVIAPDTRALAQKILEENQRAQQQHASPSPSQDTPAPKP